MKRPGYFIPALSLMAVASVAAASPRPVGVKPASGTVEAGMWAQMEKAEEHVRKSSELNREEALNAYVRSVACQVAGPYCPEIRVYVLDRSFFNASMGPNGYAEVWSGLLLRCQNEAQLAFVLGHEIGHYYEDHSIEAFKSDKNIANATLALSVGIAVVGVYAAINAPTYQYAQDIMNATGNTIDLLYLSRVSSYFSYSRRNELEADQIGLTLASSAGYAPSESIVIWRALEQEAEASDFEKVRKIGAIQNIFSAHPINSERIKAIEKALTHPSPVIQAEDPHYRQVMRPFLEGWLRQELRRKDFGQTLFLLDRLSADKEALGVIEYFRGEVYRLRRKPGDLNLALSAYERAKAYRDAPTATWRELGDVQKRLTNPTAAIAAYQEYLTRVPAAEDAWIVEQEIKGLTPEGTT
jgi:beta-barrel assembly-enhancing protease